MPEPTEPPRKVTRLIVTTSIDSVKSESKRHRLRKLAARGLHTPGKTWRIVTTDAT